MVSLSLEMLSSGVSVFRRSRERAASGIKNVVDLVEKANLDSEIGHDVVEFLTDTMAIDQKRSLNMHAQKSMD